MSSLPYPLSNAELAQLQSSYAEPAWWKEAVVYQIWPASFLNGNAQDGVGDLGGVISKVDYLKDLGADVVWLSPCYESPDKDYGYDVADYKTIAQRYGGNEQLEQLIVELKKRDMKLMMDLIVNHTSSEHAWFKESLKGRDSPKRDWYIWRKGKVGPNGEKLPPNNWVAFFTGPAWTYDEASDEWYLSIFSPWQPDLNWENASVREAVHDIARFWLDKGVAGFRMDVINEISKTYNADGSLPDAPITEPKSKYQPAVSLFCDGPRVHEFIQELGQKVLSKYDTITVGETPHAKHPDILLPWTHPARHELRSCFTFDLHDEDGDQQWPLIPKKIHLPHFAGIVNKWQTYCHRTSAWLANYFENHDQARTVSRWASDEPQHRKNAARMIALFQTSLSGSFYLYQGQEIGMRNIPQEWPIEEYKDVATVNFLKECQELVKEGKQPPADPKDVLAFAQKKARDNARTPMQWTAGANAGFTTATPWMRVQEEDAQQGWNVEAELKDDGSVLSGWRDALRGRKEYRDCVLYGNFNLLRPGDERVISYVRNSARLDEQGRPIRSLLVLLNFSQDTIEDYELSFTAAQEAQESALLEYKSEQPIVWLNKLEQRATFVLGSRQDSGQVSWKGQRLSKLRPYEGLWFELAAAT